MDKNKVAVITGGGGVLCSAFAKFLAKKGWAVAVLDLNFNMAKKCADEINENRGFARPYKANVLDKEMLLKVRDEIHSDMGKCTLLINGAGGNSPKATAYDEYYSEGDESREDVKTFFNIDKSDFGFVFDLNILGTLIPSQVFSPDMLGNKDASIINVSSMNAFTPLTKIPAYSAAKSAVSNFTQWLAVYFAKTGIRVNAIAPGFFATNQNRALLFNEDGTLTERSGKIINATPMGRFGEPEELLGALEFLSDSKMSSFVTGIIIPIDGGFSAYSGV